MADTVKITFAVLTSEDQPHTGTVYTTEDLREMGDELDVMKWREDQALMFAGIDRESWDAMAYALDALEPGQALAVDWEYA